MKEICLEAKVENVTAATDFINAELEAVGCSMKAQCQIDVAIDELFSNIAYYAYGEEKGKVWVTVDFLQDSGEASITFADEGLPYNPLENKDPDVTLSAEERQIGGLGIFLVKKTMDYIGYEYKNGKNILEIRKKI